MGIRQVGRKGRLRAPRCRYRTHGHPTHQPDQQDHGEIAAPALVKAGPEVVPGDPEGPPDHVGSASGRCVSHPSVSSGSIGPQGRLWACRNVISRGPASGDDLVLVPPNRPTGRRPMSSSDPVAPDRRETSDPGATGATGVIRGSRFTTSVSRPATISSASSRAAATGQRGTIVPLNLTRFDVPSLSLPSRFVET